MTKYTRWPLLIALAASALVSGESPKTTTTTTPGIQMIWKAPEPVETLDFVGGAGGRSRAPMPPFTFVEEDEDGTNPKMKVKDASGALWSVKWGEEVKAETFAQRLAWAAGYIVEPAYYVARGRIDGATGLKRCKNLLDSEGAFTDARFELKDPNMPDLKGRGWSWSYNPFLGTPELNGLKIIIMLTSNWDNKDARDEDRGSNTGILQSSHDGQTRYSYLVTDWGGSMGKWGGVFSREKWDCEGYVAQTPKFIKGVKDGKVEWGFRGQHTSDTKEDISVDDVRWSLRYIGGITDTQIRDGLEASGATPAEVECFAPAIRARLEQMRSVSRSSIAAVQ